MRIIVDTASPSFPSMLLHYNIFETKTLDLAQHTRTNTFLQFSTTENTSPLNLLHVIAMRFFIDVETTADTHHVRPQTCFLSLHSFGRECVCEEE
jgi:hypothetical protein